MMSLLLPKQNWVHTTFLSEVSIFLYSVSTFHVFMLREPDFNKLWSLNERTLRLCELVQKVHFYHNMVQMIFQDLR